MNKRFWVLVGVSVVLLAGAAAAQHPILDMAANKVIQKYQTATCEQLWQEKSQPKPAQEQEAVQMLRSNPQMRAEFLTKVAGPIANKLFECGMIP